MAKLIWESMMDNLGLERVAVPGGWLVRTMNSSWSGVSICFYPDPEHLWESNG